MNTFKCLFCKQEMKKNTFLCNCKSTMNQMNGIVIFQFEFDNLYCELITDTEHKSSFIEVNSIDYNYDPEDDDGKLLSREFIDLLSFDYNKNVYDIKINELIKDVNNQILLR